MKGRVGAGRGEGAAGGGRGKPVVISPLDSEAAKDGGEDLREKDHVRGGRGNWLPEVEDGGDDDGKGYAQEKGKLLGTEAAWEEGEYLVDERNKRDNSLGLCSFKAVGSSAWCIRVSGAIIEKL